jgi:anti-sigma factor RsiW
MTCEELQARLTALSLGELEPAEAAAAREHVADCSRCASRVLLDRQLTALLRASVVPAPEAVQRSVLAAVRAEAARLAGGGPADQAAGPRPSRRRHWVALGLAALMAAAVLAVTVLLVPAPDAGSPLAAAWKSYHRQPVPAGATPGEHGEDRLYAVLGPAAETPDLSEVGLRPIGWDARTLAGHLAVAAEYRDGEGRRFMLMRWRGELPHMAHAPGEDDDQLEVYRWGRHASAWWQREGVVWCLIGTVDDHSLHRVAERLAGES